MDLYEILELISLKWDSYQTLWNFYITVCLGIVAVLVSYSDKFESYTARLIIIVSFFGFALVNLTAMRNLAKDRSYLKELATQKLCAEFNCYKIDIFTDSGYKDKAIVKYVKSSYSGYDPMLYHIAQDFLMIIFIWFIPVALIRFDFSEHELLVNIDRSMLPSPTLKYKIMPNKSANKWILEKDVELNQTQIIPFNDHKNVIEGLKIEKGFGFDLASIPRYFWFLIAPFELSIIAPLVHDYIYKCEGRFKCNVSIPIADIDGKKLISRKEADKLFFKHMELENVGMFKRWVAFMAVRIFGIFYWRDN